MSPETAEWGTQTLPVLLSGFVLGVGVVATLLSAAATWARRAMGAL